MVTVRCDSAYYNHDVVAAARRGGAHFSVTARADPAVRKAIASIGEDAWVAIKYPEAIWDADEGRWMSAAEVAEVGFPAFTSRRKAEQVTARLMVRRVRRLNPAWVPAGQSELFAAYRYHAVFTDSPLPMLAAETGHRGHAIVEQVIADLKGGPLAHMPSGRFAANSAWTVLAASVQPHPRRRRPGLGVPRQGDHRDDPRPADRRPRTAGPHRRAAAHAPAPRLALGDRLEPTVQQRLRPTGRPGLLITQPQNGARNYPKWKSRTDRQTRMLTTRNAHSSSRSDQARMPAGGSRLNSHGDRACHELKDH